MNKDKHIIDTEQMFTVMVERLEKKLHFKKDSFTLKRDNRIRGLRVELYNYIDGKNEECYMITYNSKKLHNKIELLMGIVHEMGHVRKKHLTANCNLSLKEKEYQAESFALDVVKKYYKEYYLRAVDLLASYIDNQDKIYAEAFGKLYDERIGELDEKE